ncbi:RHS repeat-associated core domain-containing protein [Streptomyces sp. HMX87]|uniref:RHS repeat-associated core domain-containing protein n=1 Tax=Streptomyces sp. HMX87 TaxID=3390849 RepID=UPI003A8BF422
MLTTTVDDVDGGTPTTNTVNHTYDSADRLISAGTVYDALGRTTTQAEGTKNSYYTNDLVRQITADTERTTWTLDADNRLASWTTEEQDESGSWRNSLIRTNHYGGDGDSPDWTEDAFGGISRSLEDLAGNLIATTSRTGDTILQLSNLHGDIATQIPLVDATTPVVSSYDEYGNPLPGTDPARYGWLGGKQRSSETPSGVTLMGVRLYNPNQGRFLSVDPVPGGSANAYEYVNGDPLNQYDLNGQWSVRKRFKSWWGRKSRNPNYRHWYYGARMGASLINPAKKARYVVRYAKNPRRVTRMCSRGWKHAAGCAGAFWGVPSAFNYGRKMARNYRYMRSYNQALTYAAKQRTCRRYTGYRGRGSCT